MLNPVDPTLMFAIHDERLAAAEQSIRDRRERRDRFDRRRSERTPAAAQPCCPPVAPAA